MPRYVCRLTEHHIKHISHCKPCALAMAYSGATSPVTELIHAMHTGCTDWRGGSWERHPAEYLALVMTAEALVSCREAP